MQSLYRVLRRRGIEQGKKIDSILEYSYQVWISFSKPAEIIRESTLSLIALGSSIYVINLSEINDN